MRPAQAIGPIVLLALAGAAMAESIVLAPMKDNTLYQVDADSIEVSNGAGWHLFAGRNSLGTIRRPALAFDIAGQLPAGAIVTAAGLGLHVSLTGSGAQTVSLHRFLADWGEGASDALGSEGRGAPAEAGDVTWFHRFHPDDPWLQAGGDFAAAVSASQIVNSVGFYVWNDPQLTADVQAWLDDPASNCGWILRGEEGIPGMTKRFDSRENPDPQLRPSLWVEYSADTTAVSQSPDGAQPGSWAGLKAIYKDRTRRPAAAAPGSSRP